MHFETAHMYFHNEMVLNWPQLQSIKDKIVPKLPNNKKLFNFMEVTWKIGNDYIEMFGF